MAHVLPQPPRTSVVRDTIAAVFERRPYDRTLARSLLDRLMEELIQLLDRVFTAVGSSRLTRPIVITILAIAVLLLLAHVTAVISAAARARDPRIGRLGFGRRADPWAEAQHLARERRYTDAAHALYAALLEGLAQREDLRLHPSKTVGDYLRELRRRSSVFVPSFRDFARLYEVVVYGLGFCDQERYERLYTLATGMLAPRA